MFRNIGEAVDAFIDPLQQSVSCFTRDVLKVSNRNNPKSIQTATFNRPVIDLITSRGEVLYLSFSHHYELAQDLDEMWAVHTVGYLYAIENSEGNEILTYHWHPEAASSAVLYPHLHIGHGAGYQIREEIRSTHFRTNRTAFEDLGLILIEQFGVVPDKDEAKGILTQNLQEFRRVCSWNSVPENGT